MANIAGGRSALAIPSGVSLVVIADGTTARRLHASAATNPAGDGWSDLRRVARTHPGAHGPGRLGGQGGEAAGDDDDDQGGRWGVAHDTHRSTGDGDDGEHRVAGMEPVD
jgi:hypothetical protein